jgi:hypothetical protein
MNELRLIVVVLLLSLADERVFGGSAVPHGMTRQDSLLAASKKKPTSKPVQKPRQTLSEKPTPKATTAAATLSPADDEMHLAASGAIALDARTPTRGTTPQAPQKS